MKSAFGVEHNIAKSSAAVNATEVAGGTGMVVGAANTNRVFDGYNTTRRKFNNRRNTKIKGQIKALKSVKDSPSRKAKTKKLYGKIADNNRKTNIAVKRLGYKSRVGTAATGFLVGAPIAWHGARELVEKGQTKKQKKVDAGFAGAASGAGGYQLGLYATKPIDRMYEKKQSKLAASSKPGDINNPRAKLNAHRRKVGLPKNAQVGDPRWLEYHRKFPKGVPGWKFKRAMSYAHGGKAGVAATVGMGALGAGVGVANTKEKKK